MQKKVIHTSKKLFLVLAFALLANVSFSQNIVVSTATVSFNPVDCNYFTVSSSGTIFALNYTVQGYSYTVSGNTITVTLDFTNPFIILPAIGSYNHTATINTTGNVPAGSYTVVVEAVQGGTFQSSASTNTTVGLCCPAIASATTNDNFICLGDTATLVSQSQGANTYSWFGSSGGQSLSSNDTITVSPTTAGTYTYTLEAGDGSCSTFDTVTIQVDDIPVFDLGADTSFCYGNSLLLNAIVNNLNATYSWQNSNISGSIISADTTGTYAATVSVNNCVYQDSINVTVLSAPNISLPNDTLVCFGENVTLDVTQSGSTYSWNTGSTASSILADSAGTYTVTVTNSSNCSSTDNFVLTINPEVVVTLVDTAIFFPNDSILLDAGNQWFSYLWSTGDTTETIYASSEGTYTVTVTDEKGCTGTAAITVLISGNERVEIPTLTVYPNPAQAVLNIELAQLEYLIEHAAIYNNLGQIVDYSRLNSNQLNIGHLTSGMYFVRLLDANNEVLGIARFIKE